MPIGNAIIVCNSAAGSFGAFLLDGTSLRLGPATLQNQRVRHADISPDGTLVAVSITSTNGARVVSADPFGADAGWAPIFDSAYQAKFSPNGQMLAVVGTTNPVYLRVYDVATKSLVSGVPSDAVAGARSVSWSHDGAWLAVAYDADPRLVIYDTTTWLPVPGVPDLSGQLVSFVEFQRRDTQPMLAVGISFAPMRLYNTMGWTQLAPPIATPTTGAAFSQAGDLLAVCSSAEPYLSVIDANTFTLLPVVAAATLYPSGKPVWTADGKLAICYTSGDPSAIIVSASLDSIELQNLAIPTPAHIATSIVTMRTLSGVITDASESPLSRTVYAIHDATRRPVGAAVSSAVDGSYEIATPYGDGHTLMLLEGTGRVQALGTGVLPV